MKLIEYSACKLKIRRSEISGNSLPVHHSFRHSGMVWGFFVFFGGFFFPPSCAVSEWIGAQWTLLTGTFEIHLHLSSTPEWVLAIAPECLGTKEWLGTKENTSASHCTSWWHWHSDGLVAPSLTMQVKWDGWVFLVVWEESLYRMKETGLPGFLESEKESWYLGGWSNCIYLGLCQQAWHRDCLGWQWEHILCRRDKPQHCFSLCGRDVLEVYFACGALVGQGTCRPSAGAIAGRGEEWSCGSAASVGLGSHGFNSWLCCCLPVGRAWSGTLSSSVSQLLIARYHIILKPQPICSRILHIAWQPTALLVSSMGNLWGDIGPNQNPEAPGPPALESGSCSFCEIEN